MCIATDITVLCSTRDHPDPYDPYYWTPCKRAKYDHGHNSSQLGLIQNTLVYCMQLKHSGAQKRRERPCSWKCQQEQVPPITI